MARTRLVPRRRPNANANTQQQRADIDFQAQRVAATKNAAATKEQRRRIRVSDVKIKFLLPQVKNVEVKHRGNVVRKMIVRRVAKHGAKKRNVVYR